MGSGNSPIPSIMNHFFKHLGVPELSAKMSGALIEAVERDMRRSGELGKNEMLWIEGKKLSAVAKKNLELVKNKKSRLGQK